MHIKPPIQAIPSFGLFQKVDLLRLDLLHPIVSGNKFYKLRYYIELAIENGTSTIASFGGPYSNHIVALAYTAKNQYGQELKKILKELSLSSIIIKSLPWGRIIF